MKTYIWTLPSRVSHWLMAFGFAIAYILSDFESFQNYHFAFGILVGFLAFFRLLFGFFGPKYSHFRDFPIGFKNQIEFAKTFFTNSKVYAGHNPAASMIMIGIFITAIVTSISGYLLYGTENAVFNLGYKAHFFKEIHEVAANIFLVLVILHLLGTIADTVFHSKNGTLKSIFTGYKSVDAENAQLSSAHKIFSILWFIVPFIFFYLAYNFPINEKENEKNKNQIENIEKGEDEEDDD